MGYLEYTDYSNFDVIKFDYDDNKFSSAKIEYTDLLGESKLTLIPHIAHFGDANVSFIVIPEEYYSNDLVINHEIGHALAYTELEVAYDDNDNVRPEVWLKHELYADNYALALNYTNDNILDMIVAIEESYASNRIPIDHYRARLENITNKTKEYGGKGKGTPRGWFKIKEELLKN